MEDQSREKSPLFSDLVRFRRELHAPAGGAPLDAEATLAEGMGEAWAQAGHHAQMLEALPLGVLTVGIERDLYRRPTGYRILQANPAALASLRMGLDVLVTRPLFDILPGGEEWKAPLDGVAVHGRPAREVCYSAIANAYFDVSVSRPVRDLLNIVLAEVRAPVRRPTSDKGDEILFQDILEAAPIFICRFLTDGSLTYANPAYRGRFGGESATLVGHCFLIHVPLTQRNRVQRELRGATAEQRVMVCEHEVYDDGVPRWYRWHDVAVFDKVGQVVEFQAFGYEVTQQKTADEQHALTRGYLEDLLDYRVTEIAGLERKLAAEEQNRERTVRELSQARRELDFAVGRALGGKVVMCGRCHRVNDDEGHWMPIDMYLRSHSAAELTTEICPYCKRKPRQSDIHDW